MKDENFRVPEKYEMVEISKLIPYANNARTHPDEQIKKIQSSIREFGFINPVIIDKKYNIIAGHGRVIAAEREGIKKIPCLLVEHLTDAQRKAYILADNRLAEMSGWDEEILQIELEGLTDFGIELEILGFDNIEIELAGEENTKDEVIEDDFDVDKQVESITKWGDVFILGNHRLMCGDSTDTEQVKKLMEDEVADLFLTDPPYNVDYVGKTKDNLTIKNDKMEDTSFREFLIDAFTNADMVLRGGGAYYIWHSDIEGYNFRGACKDVGWKVRQCLIWNKNSFVMGRQDYQCKHEPCLYGWKDGAAHEWSSDRKQTTVLEFDRPTRSELHPTMKPIALFDYQICNNTNQGDVILDLFAGSGTTIMACEQNGRKAYCMELDPHYCDVIIKRWEEFTGEKAKKVIEC